MRVILESDARLLSGTASIVPSDGAPAFDAARAAWFRLKVTAVSGTLPTLDVYLQRKIGPGEWLDWIAFTQRTATGDEIATWSAVASPTGLRAVTDGSMAAGVQQGLQPGQAVRVKWVIGGTIPSFTFGVTGEAI